MANNNWVNTNWVSMEILRLLLNKLIVAEYFNRSWEKDFRKEFAPGSTIQVKFPQRMLAVDGMGYAPQGINRISTTIALDQWIQVPFEWDDYEQAVKLERSEEELRENYWEPAAAAIAQECDSRCAKFAYQNASQVVGALGTDPTLVGVFYQARQRLMDMACPPGKRCMLISSSAMTSMGAATGGGSILSMFQPADEITSLFKDGSIGRLAGFDVFESNSLYSHTAGTWGGAVTVNGANQTGTGLKINATAGDTFKAGDKFSIALVNAVNPMTRRIAGKARLKEFTITKDMTAIGGGNAADVLQILPAIYPPGSQYQNVDALPGNTAPLTLWPGTTSPNGKVGTVGLGLSRFAFALVGAKLYVPKAVEQAGQASDPDTGISVRKVVAWDPVRSMQIHRMDSLMGFGSLYQDNGAVTVAGA
jgi:hypothetical protein